MKPIGIKLFPENVYLCAITNMLFEWLQYIAIVFFILFLAVYIEYSCTVAVAYLTYRFQKFAGKNLAEEFKGRPESFWIAASTTVCSTVLPFLMWKFSPELPAFLSGTLAKNIWITIASLFACYLVEALCFSFVTARPPRNKTRVMPITVVFLLFSVFLALVNIGFLTHALWLSILLITQGILLYQWILYRQIGLQVSVCGLVSIQTAWIVQKFSYEWLQTFSNRPGDLLVTMNAATIALFASLASILVTFALVHLISKSFGRKLDQCMENKGKIK